MRNSAPVFWIAAASAVGLYWYGRTRYGVRYIQYDTPPSSGGIVEAVTEGVVEVAKKVVDALSPRGIRNNNPGNIERSGRVRWVGMAPDQSSDPRFVVFSAPEWGLRAIARVLRSYRSRGLVSVRQIVTTWAPPHENATESYVAAVARALGIGADTPVSDVHLPGLIAAIVKHENGQQPYSPEMIAKAIRLEQET